MEAGSLSKSVEASVRLIMGARITRNRRRQHSPDSGQNLAHLMEFCMRLQVKTETPRTRTEGAVKTRTRRTHLASLRCQRCRCRRPLDSSWSNSRSPRLPRSPPAIKQRCWNCGGDGFGGGDDGDDHLSGQGEGGGGGGGGGRGCAGKTANLEDSKSY